MVAGNDDNMRSPNLESSGKVGAKRKQLTRAAQHTQKQLAHDCPPVNELDHAAQQASLNLIQQVEIEGIGRGLPVNGVIAGCFGNPPKSPKESPFL
ncbi:hypothetical protein H6F98_26030 [Microcoleus sp. FACHB-SPT15]|uniref:hypothetical protein n=1 Tax=Microcoleus sp. FACHB-SPT15 TaxID=2692830 RepID=UPI00177B180C|nr:hypothetical protein [Microcoleus sp. FACHB-SPT15]MBD1808887.1 hypothetical protein [Microcoleus sp. FACHB-SPT15]